jgi:hypothetical protein
MEENKREIEGHYTWNNLFVAFFWVYPEPLDRNIW